MSTRVSEKTIRRLSHYARCLRRAQLRCEMIVTSQQLADNCGISSAAVRRDLSTFGEFGKQGSGYRVNALLENIESILGTTSPPGIAVVGAGNIGQALVKSGFAGAGGYEYSGIFDSDPSAQGLECAGLTVGTMNDLAELLKNEPDTIVVLAVSPGQGQKTLDSLYEMGCRAVLSFNLEPMIPGEDLFLRYVEVSTELDILTNLLRRG